MTKNPGMERKWGDTACTGSERSGGGSFLCGGTDQKQMETGILAEEIAVLFRVHTDARAVVEALIDEKIPFQMREHLPNLYNHFIAKDIMAYFRLAMGQRERKDFLQVMNRPKRYLGRDCLPGRVVSFEEMHKFYCDKEWMQDRIDQFEWDLKMLAKMAPYAAIQYLKKKSDMTNFCGNMRLRKT